MQQRVKWWWSPPLAASMDRRPPLGLSPLSLPPRPRPPTQQTHASTRTNTQVICSVNNSLYCGPLEKFGTEEQKKTWCVRATARPAACPPDRLLELLTY